MKNKSIEDKLCESFFAKNLSEALAKTDEISAFGELRFNLSDLNISDMRKIKEASPVPIIFTCRKGKYSEKDRLYLYQTAISLSFKYIDLDINDDRAFMPILHELIAASTTQLIVSSHDYEACPSKSSLQKIVEEASFFQADLTKIVCTAANEKELETLEIIQKENPNTICFSMGDLATKSRIRSLRNKGLFTYVSLNTEKSTAKGQINSLDFQKAYSEYRGMENLKLAVLGNPIAHSKSPKIFNDIFNKANIIGIYEKIELNSVEEFKKIKNYYDGFSVTAPFKQSIIPFLDQLSDASRTINAVNSVFKKEGIWIGENTDYIGIMASVKQAPRPLFEIKNCLVIGAGGAARAAIYAMNTLNISCAIINRTARKAEELAEEFGATSVNNTNVNLQKYQLIINTIPQPFHLISSSQLTKDHLVLDAIYHHSPFEEAQKRQAKFQLINGEIWLKEQAKAFYKIFENRFD